METHNSDAGLAVQLQLEEGLGHAGLSLGNYYFRLYPCATKTEQVIDFLNHLQRHVKGEPLIVWDGVATHRSRLVRQYLKSLRQQNLGGTSSGICPRT